MRVQHFDRTFGKSHLFLKNIKELTTENPYLFLISCRDLLQIMRQLTILLNMMYHEHLYKIPTCD